MNKYLAISLSLFAILITGCAKIKDCGTDFDCFKVNAKTCSRAKANLINEDNNIRVTIRGHSVDYCRVSFKIENIGENMRNKYPTESGIAIGKTMNCKVDKKYSEYKDLDYIEEITNLPNEFDRSCSGPIKDLMEGPLKEIMINEFKSKLSDKNI